MSRYKYKVIEFEKTDREIRESFYTLVEHKSIPEFYKNIDLRDMKKAYVPIFLFDGSIDGAESRVYKNVSHNVVVTPVVSSFSTHTSYDGNNKTGHVEFANFPMVINKKFKAIFSNNFDCEYILEPYDYEKAKEIDQIDSYQFDAPAETCDLDMDRIIEEASKEMERVLSVRMFSNAEGSFMGAKEKYVRTIDGSIVMVPVYYTMVKIEGAGIVYLLGNGQTGETYMNVLDQIGGYAPLGTLAEGGIMAACAGVLVGLGALIHKGLPSLSFPIMAILLALVGLGIGYLIGRNISTMIVESQIKKARNLCIGKKNISYLNSGYDFVVPGSVRVR